MSQWLHLVTDINLFIFNRSNLPEVKMFSFPYNRLKEVVLYKNFVDAYFVIA